MNISELYARACLNQTHTAGHVKWGGKASASDGAWVHLGFSISGMLPFSMVFNRLLLFP